MRTDKHFKRYTGCLTGLGYSTTPRAEFPGQLYASGHYVKPHNQDHDSEITFDVIIDNEDIYKINEIRYYINYALSRSVQRKGKVTLL